MSGGTRTTFKVTVAGRRVVDFSTLRKGDKFILQDDPHPLSMEKGNVCNVATSDAYLRGGIWTIDCEEIEGSGKRIKRGSHPDDWNKPFTIKSSPKVTTEDLLNDDPIFPFTTRPSEVAEEMTEIEDERILATALGASKDFLEGPTTYSTSSIGYDPTIRQLVRKMADPFFRAMTRDEYVKANLVGEMRKHRGRKRLRKKKAKAALRQRWGFLQLGRMLSRRINYAEISRKMFTVEPLPDPVKPIYMRDIDIADVVAGGEE